MSFRFVLCAVATILLLIAAGDYRYYSRISQRYLMDTASLAREIEKTVSARIPIELSDMFLGLEVLPGRDRDELGIRMSWSRLTSTPELATETRFDLVIDGKVFVLNQHLFIERPCLRTIENATDKMRQLLNDDELQFFIRQGLGDGVQIALAGVPHVRPMAGDRQRVVTRVRVGPDQTLFVTGLPDYRNQAYVPPKGWPGSVDQGCQSL